MDGTVAGSEESLFPGTSSLDMTDREFTLFSTLIYSRLGIKMPYTKKLMLISRLAKRLRLLGLRSFNDYYEYISAGPGRSDEFIKMVDAVTTNKTDFFREPDHFDILSGKVLGEITGSALFKERNRVNVWSAGCSSGEEAYTISMVLSEYFKGDLSRFSILATDISTRVLGAGAEAVYSESVVEHIPQEYKKKYLMRGTGEKAGFYRIVPELRNRVAFRRLNLMDENFAVDEIMDIIFCRNVIIYFDRETQTKLFKKFYRHLAAGGYLFIGSSETLYGINDDFKPVGPTVYKKPR